MTAGINPSTDDSSSASKRNTMITIFSVENHTYPILVCVALNGLIYGLSERLYAGLYQVYIGCTAVVFFKLGSSGVEIALQDV